MTETIATGRRQIGVALSGGGHRATVWGLGALLAIADAGLNHDVVSVSSVSGGSIANGVVAHRLDYRASSASEVAEAMRPCLRLVAHDGLFFFGPATDGYLAGLFLSAGLAMEAVVAALVGAFAAGRGWAAWWFLPASLLAAVLFRLTAPRRGAPRPAAPPPPRSIPSRLRVEFIALGLAAGPVVAGAVALVTHRHGRTALAIALGLAAVAVVAVAASISVFARRSLAVDRALAEVLFHEQSGGATKLAAVDRSVHHVFCCTELQAGDHCYLTPRLVYSYRAGAGRPGALELSTAVQCSACLPGAFAPRTLDPAALGFDLRRDWPLDDGGPRTPPRLVVNDGGVYDNMADQWEQGYTERARRLHLAADGCAGELLVVNAGKALGWKDFPRLGAVGREVVGLARTIDILYDVSTSHRRQALVRRFGTGDALPMGADLRGILVHIARSPFHAPERFRHSPDPDRRRRAEEALAFLEGLGADPGKWEERAAANAGVATTLGGLGAEVTVDLLEHAYVLTRVNLYVVLGAGSLAGHEAEFARSRLAALVEPAP